MVRVILFIKKFSYIFVHVNIRKDVSCRMTIRQLCMKF